MSTKITHSNHGDSLQGSMEKRLDVAPDGTLWALIVTQGSPGTAKFFRSANNGSSWTYAAGSDISLLQSSAVPSFFLDADGYAHVSWLTWNSDPQVVKYARGTPTGGGGWSWQYLTVSPADRLGVDTDIIAFRNGTGWSVWICWNTTSTTGGKVSQIAVSQSGALSVVATTSGPSTGGAAFQPGSLEFLHTGDGKTPSATPNIFYTSFLQGTAGAIRLNRAVYSGGTWTWASPVTGAASANVLQTALCSVWDGSRLMVAYGVASSATISCFEWDGSSGSVTARNPPAAPGGTGTVLGLSLSCDPSTGDLYLVSYDATNGDIYTSHFVRSTTTWSAWAVAVSQSPPTDGADGKVQLVRHPPRDSVDMIYGQGGDVSWDIFSQQLVALTRSPTAPTLISPASGALVDLAVGATFSWQYNPVSPGDTQQGYVFRRILGATTQYWVASSQSWSSSLTVNTSSISQVSFPSAMWTDGNTYTWSVRTRSSTGADSSFAADRTVIATAAPVIAVTGPSGITYGESTPLVTWTYTGLDAQRDYQVRIIAEQNSIDPDVTSPVWDSGVISSNIARSARVGTALSDGVAYRAYVRANSVIGVTSAWNYSAFVVSISPPLGPVVELRDSIKYETSVPRVRMDVLAQSNFMTANQALGQELWTNDANATVAAQAFDSSAQLVPSVKLTSIASGLVGAVSSPGSPPLAPYGQPQPAGPLNWPVTPAVPYTAMASFKAASTTRAARVSIRWYDADDGTGALISTSVGNQVTTGTTSYTQATITDTAPPTARLARVLIEVLGATASSEVFYATNLAFAPGRSMTWQAGGYWGTQTVHVERSLDGGVTWQVVVDRLKPDLYQQAVAEDRLMPYRTDVKYRAATVVDTATSQISSTFSLTSTIRIDAELWSVRDVSDDLGECNLYVTDITKSEGDSSSVHRPAGRLYPVVDTEGAQASTGYLTAFVFQKDKEATIAVIKRIVPFCVQSPSGEVFYARLIQRDYAVDLSRHRDIRIQYVEVEPLVVSS